MKMIHQLFSAVWAVMSMMANAIGFETSETMTGTIKVWSVGTLRLARIVDPGRKWDLFCWRSKTLGEARIKALELHQQVVRAWARAETTRVLMRIAMAKAEAINQAREARDPVSLSYALCDQAVLVPVQDELLRRHGPAVAVEGKQQVA